MTNSGKDASMICENLNKDQDNLTKTRKKGGGQWKQELTNKLAVSNTSDFLSSCCIKYKQRVVAMSVGGEIVLGYLEI
jgi:hypothetical protein